MVGTHALIEDPVRFASLGVAVVDEQHRFGVSQRAALDRRPNRARVSHMLHMSATPIPRTLALAGYGDLDFTVLRELPRGRKPVAHVRLLEARASGRARTSGSAKRCERVVRRLSLPARGRVRVTPGACRDRGVRTPARRRARDWRSCSYTASSGQPPSRRRWPRSRGVRREVLVATSVIEVGIDVPNATVMLIEDADRYGISQLHQLRGRIGRGGHRRCA